MQAGRESVGLHPSLAVESHNLSLRQGAILPKHGVALVDDADVILGNENDTKKPHNQAIAKSQNN